MSAANLQIIQTAAGLSADVRSMIEATRDGVARTVNVGMTLLYWRIGKRIQSEVLKNERADYGKEILATLSQELTDPYVERELTTEPRRHGGDPCTEVNPRRHSMTRASPSLLGTPR